MMYGLAHNRKENAYTQTHSHQNAYTLYLHTLQIRKDVNKKERKKNVVKENG